MSQQVFDAEDVAAVDHFREHGWVTIATLNYREAERLAGWVADIASRSDDSGVLHYREMTDAGARLCRTEHFIPFHDELRELLTRGGMLRSATSLLGEAAVLYKEKINYKLVGGAGYAPHQDAPAYPFIQTHISCMIAVDAADESNGCLEVVSGAHHGLLAQDDVGCIRAEVVDALEWRPAPLAAGQTLWFHSRTPHRSGPNRSSRDRRAIYPTYNAAREGDLRAEYYRTKLDRMARSRVGDNVQVSLIGDFQGRPV